MRTRILTLTLTAFAAIAVLQSTPADAGCGCNKPPPPASTIRPAFASSGDVVTIISTNLVVGRAYSVRFGGLLRGVVIPGVVAVSKRDLADGVYKPMLEVAAPTLSSGPKRVRVYKPNSTDDVLINVPKTDFTLMQPALALQEGDTETVAKCYQAAVSSNNEVLIPLNIGAIAQHMIFNGLGDDYPLLFGAADVAIYNTQGFLMQMLGPQQAGIFAIDDPGDPGSMELTYDRHEFVTYRQDHAHIGGLGLDPTDQRWHTDGTYHVDHDHLVIAIKGIIDGYGAPAPGRTASFNLRITTALADDVAPVVVSRTIQWSTKCRAAGTTPINQDVDDDNT